MRHLAPISILMAAMFAAISAPAFAEVKYAAKDLGVLQTGLPSPPILVHGNYSNGFDINNAGDIVGEANTYESLREIKFHAFLSHNGGPLIDLGAGLPVESRAVGINAAGQILIRPSNFNLTDASSYLYSGGTFTAIGPGTAMVGINDSGQAVGSRLGHTVVYQNGTLHDLGTLGGVFTYPEAINNSGQIVGRMNVLRDGTEETHGFLYSNGVVQDLGLSVWPHAINDAGEIVGELFGPGVAGVAFVYRDGHLTQFRGTASAWAINNAGTIVGTARFDPAGEFHAAIFEGEKILDLNSLISPGFGLTMTAAYGINDLGQITGSSYPAQHAFLLTPLVPEPAALPVVLFGAALLRRRRAA